MKAYWGSGCIAPLILSPWHYVEVSGQLHAPAALPTRKEPLVPVSQLGTCYTNLELIYYSSTQLIIYELFAMDA
jgi:hypothetical protein